MAPRKRRTPEPASGTRSNRHFCCASSSHLAFFLILGLAATGCSTDRVTSREQFNREINIRREDPKTGIPNWIEVRPDIKVSIAHFWKRYEQFLRIPPAALEKGAPRPDRLGAGTLTFFQQVHLGYPVANGGYLVEAENGLVRNAMGKFIVGLPASLPHPISQKAALDVAIGFLRLQGPPPWTLPNSAGYHPPEPTLSLAPEGPDGSYKLIWWVSFAGTGLGFRANGEIAIDAASGAIIGKTPGNIR